MGFMDFARCPEFEITRKHSVSETDVFLSSGEERETPENRNRSSFQNIAHF
jgi:hypothetical protein